jgi:hypothetical protein
VSEERDAGAREREIEERVLSVEIDSLCIASAESGGSGKRIKAWCAGGASGWAE